MGIDLLGIRYYWREEVSLLKKETYVGWRCTYPTYGLPFPRQRFRVLHEGHFERR